MMIYIILIHNGSWNILDMPHLSITVLVIFQLDFGNWEFFFLPTQFCIVICEYRSLQISSATTVKMIPLDGGAYSLLLLNTLEQIFYF